MERIFQALRPFIRGVIQHKGLVLALAFLTSAFGLFFARQLSIDTDFANLIPQSYPSVQAIERLRETVGGESEASVAIESASFNANKAFAEVLIPRALALKGEGYDEPYFSHVDYRKDITFLEDNALYFANTEELDKLDTWLRDKIEGARLEANPFYFDLDEDEEEVDSTAEELQAAYDEIVDKEYPVSADSLTMVLRFYPLGSTTDIGFIEDAYRDLETLIAELQPATFDPAMKITTAGRMLRQLTEIRAISNDVLNSFGVGVSIVLLMVVLYFFYKAYHARSGGHFSLQLLAREFIRIPVMAVVIGLPLLMSLSWTFGVAYLAYTELNLMTSTLGLVLFGLGIDYGIHFYARYSEERAEGRSVLDAAEVTFSSTGQAVTVGALTTSAALYVLVMADFKGFSEFGFIAGTGILFALVAMLVVMPALIAVLERFKLLNMDAPLEKKQNNTQIRPYPAARSIMVGSIAAVLVALIFLPRVGFEYDFGKLEPTYEEFNARREITRRVYDDRARRNPAYIVLDTPEEVAGVTRALREKMAQDTLSPTISSIESLQDRFPLASEAQDRKLERLAIIRTLLDDPFLKAEDSEDLDRLRRAAQTTEAVALEEVPKFMRERFTSKTGEIGNFVIIYPSVGLSDGRNSIAFSEDVGTVETEEGLIYHAGSTSLIAADMLQLMRRESPWMVGATFFIVVVLMLINFRSLRWAMVALLPLVVGILWMLLLMEFLGLRMNFYNLIVLPAILGIGNDAGVHLVHRYREGGGRDILRVLRSTGEHVTMGSLTTMVGFAGLLLSFHPGLRSIGELAVVGIGTTLLAALVFLPALLQVMEKPLQIPTARTPEVETLS